MMLQHLGYYRFLQCVLVPRKIGELELDFENPTWKSNWDFEEFTTAILFQTSVAN